MPTLNPYLSFRDTAAAAMDFYREVFGGDLTVSTFGDFPGTADPAEADLVMHAQLTTPQGFVLMASDTPAHVPYTPPAGISVCVTGDDEAQLQGFWDALTAGGTVVMPFETPPWGGRFGMVTDRFGIDWMVAYSPAEA